MIYTVRKILKKSLKKKLLIFGLPITIVLVAVGFFIYNESQIAKSYGAPPYVEDDANTQQQTFDLFSEYSNWKRPEGPIRIGLQAGHWKTSEMPEEQYKIRDAGGGTSGQGIPEWQVALNIAEKTKKLLEEKGYVVDILPATVPSDYWADVFVSIHADGNLNPLVHGYKIAAYRRDRTGDAETLSKTIEASYGQTTGFRLDPNITRNMTGYYAFNYRRYEHAVHPMTPSVILETGFLTNAGDAKILINAPEIPAKGLAEGVIKFIDSTQPTE